jgi:TatA/E family protein of Tat protein translocase
MFGLGPFEIVLIGAIAVMLYGKRLPEVGRNVGKTVGDLRRQWQQLSRELEVAANAESVEAAWQWFVDNGYAKQPRSLPRRQAS